MVGPGRDDDVDTHGNHSYNGAARWSERPVSWRMAAANIAVQAAADDVEPMLTDLMNPSDGRLAAGRGGVLARGWVGGFVGSAWPCACTVGPPDIPDAASSLVR
jgi:hypothetical protein